MATIKSFTSLEQSKKLAEILPLESADGFWEYHEKWCSEGDEWEGYEDYPRAEPYLEYTRKENEWKEDRSDVPCWSLASLLGILPRIDIEKEICSDDTFDYRVKAYIGDGYIGDWFDNPVDVCVAMIEKLHKLNLL